MSFPFRLMFAAALLAAAPALPAEGQKVFVAEVRRDRFVDRLEALGTLRANESVTISPSITEIITAIHFDDGDHVTKGQVLVEMTGSEERALLEEMKAMVEEAQRQYERVNALTARGTEARSMLDQRRREWDTAKARLKAVESRLADRVIRAPFSGVVGLRQVSAGALVEPGDTITTLDDDSVMKLDFPVSATYLDILRPGLRIEARSAAFGERVFRGEVKSVDSRVDPVTRSILVRALLPNPDRSLKPGLLMGVELLPNPREALVIPESALIALRDEQFVHVVSENSESRVERRKVRIGGRRPGEVEVLEGLSEGERIVTDGSFKVQHGETVTVQGVEKGRGLVDLLPIRPARGDTP